MKNTLTAALGLLLCSNILASSNNYHILSKIPISGDGSWDCISLDTGSRKLFVSHGTKVSIINIDSASVLGTISELHGVHGIAISPEFNRGFITNGKSNTVTIFDLKSLTKLADVPTGTNPDVIIYDPSSRSIFAFNGKSQDVTVINAEKGTVSGTVKLGGKPEFGVSDGVGHIFVNLEDKNCVAMIDTKTLKIKKQWSIAPGKEPSGLAIDMKHHRLFIGCGNQKMVIVNSKTGQVVSSLPIGDHSDGVAFDSTLNLAFSSNGDGTLTVIHEESPNKYSVVETIPTQVGAKTMALDPKTHHIYLPVAQRGPAPSPTTEIPHPRPPILPGTFGVLVVGQ